MMNKTLKSLLILLIGLPMIVSAQTDQIQKRLDAIKKTVDMKADESVESIVQKATHQDKDQWEKALSKAAFYIPAIEDTLNRYGIPKEIALATLGWSQMDQTRISEDGGSGFWQMRYIDARQYGVHISSYVDERRDAYASTSAAAKYLNELYKEYGDWLLALTAFQSGTIEVNKAIRMTSGSKDYWTIRNNLPDRYQSAVPQYIAAYYLYYYWKTLKLDVDLYKPQAADTVMINNWSSLVQIASALNTDHEVMQDLNPIFKKDVIPHASNTYYIRIPKDKVARFDSLGDSIYTYPVENTPKDEVDPTPEINTPKLVEPAGRSTSTQSGSSSSGTSGLKPVYYTVRQGDYLGRIADIYDVGVSQVRRWNNIRGDRININQKLLIYVPASKYSTYSQYNSYSTSQLNRIVKKD